jgi:nucleoside phosphorylase
MSLHRPPRSRSDFQTAIICTLPVEADAVGAMFDEYWHKDGGYTKAPGDTNAYVTGRIGYHNVVMAFVPGMGKGAAAGVAGGLRSSYPQVKLALVVGVCGGVPYTPDGEEILLGDVIISDGIVQYDFGKQYPDKFIRKDTLVHSLQRPDLEIRSLIAKLKTKVLRDHLSGRSAKYLSLVGMANSPYGNSLRLQAKYPGPAEDKLFESTYHHKHHDDRECDICSSMDGHICNRALDLSCRELGCDEMMLVHRRRLLTASEKAEEKRKHKPVTHFGLIASGDTVMKSSLNRDTIAAHENVIAYEMEGAGVWDILPCLLIKGVCDYADSHKSKLWQGYAAMTAAACLKAFLEQWTSAEMRNTYDGSQVSIVFFFFELVWYSRC